jgi:hypothetical protein
MANGEAGGNKGAGAHRDGRPRIGVRARLRGPPTCPPSGASRPLRPTDTWEALTPMAMPRHGLHGATCAVIGNKVHVRGGGPVHRGSVQAAYHDAFTFG